MYEKAAWLTLRIGLLGIVFAIIVGFVCSTIQYYKVPVLRQIVAVYIELSRNTPLLVQLFFIYYGLPKIGIQTNAEACGVAGLAFLGGSYMAEAFRSGLEAIEPIQTESAYSLGMNRYQTMRYIILPQAMSISVPAFVANVIFLLKETSVFSAISLMDLMFTAKDLIGLYYKTTESLFLLVVFYLILLLPISILGSLLERRLRYAGFVSSLSFPVTSMIKDESGIVPKNSRVSSITHTGELLFVIKGSISSNTVSSNTECTSVRTTVSMDFSCLLRNLSKSFRRTSPTSLSSASITGNTVIFFARILRIKTSGPSFFRRATNGLSIIKEEAVIILLLSTFSTKRAIRAGSSCQYYNFHFSSPTLSFQNYFRSFCFSHCFLLFNTRLPGFQSLPY